MAIIDFLQSMAVIVASLAAVIGINEWRKEAKWKRKFQIAEETLAAFYDVSDRLEIIRSPFSYSSEGKTRKPSDNETETERENKDRAYVVIERFEREQEAFVNLRKLKYRFMAVFGKEYSKPFEEVNILINKILSANKMLGEIFSRDYISTTSSYKDENYIKQKEKFESIIWSLPKEEKDEIRESMNNAIIIIEKVCQQIQ